MSSTPDACLRIAEQYPEHRLPNATRYRTAQAENADVIMDTPRSYSEMSVVDVEMADVSPTPPRWSDHRYVSFPPLVISPTRTVSPNPHPIAVSYSTVVLHSPAIRKLSTTGFTRRKSTSGRRASWETRKQPGKIPHISEKMNECPQFLTHIEYELSNVSVASKQMSSKLDSLTQRHEIHRRLFSELDSELKQSHKLS